MRHLRPLLPYLRRYRRPYLWGLALTVVSNILLTLGPWFLGQGVDALEAGRPFREVAIAASLLVAVALAGGVARYGMRQLLNSGSRRVENDLRDDLFAHLQGLPAEFHDRSTVGDLMSRATNDLLNIRMAVGPALMYLTDTLTRTLLVVPFMLAISPRLTLLALLPLAVLPPVMIVFGQAIHDRSLAIQTHFATMTDFVREHLTGVRIVRAYRQEGAETGHFAELNREYMAKNFALARAYGAFHPALTLLGGLGAVAVLYLGGKYVMAGTVSAGAFIAFGVYLMTLIWPMVALGWVVNLYQRGSASMRRVHAVFSEAPAIRSPEAPRPLPAAAGARAVAFEDVWFQYPNARDRGWVLKGISFRVEPGRSLAVVGPTGAGKSSLVDLIARAYDPDRGRVLLDGIDLRELDLADLRNAVGFVPQETFLFSDTLRNNLLQGAPDDGRLERAAETAQLSEALPDLPRGMDTLLGERGINLSGGQKQRAAIARALVKDPPVFVLDDALSAVDIQTETRILHRLRDALAGRTTIIVSHRLAAVREADWILVLDQGQIVEQGTHPDLMSRKGRYRDLLQRQELEEELESAGAEAGRGEPG